MNTVRMKCPEGTTTISVGGRQFISNREGVVEIPAEYEHSLYAFGLLTIGKNIPEPEPEPDPEEPVMHRPRKRRKE